MIHICIKIFNIYHFNSEILLDSVFKHIFRIDYIIKAITTLNKITCQNDAVFIFIVNPIVIENITIKVFLHKCPIIITVYTVE